jgi:dynein intermediate chain
MSDKSDLKAELERKKQRLAQIREEKKRKEEERKKKEVNIGCLGVWGTRKIT